MSRVIREIHIEATPETVRRHVTDPIHRRDWLDDEPLDPVQDADGGLTYRREDEDRTSRVRIEVLPDGPGTKVRVTEQVERWDGDDVAGAAADTRLLACAA